MAWEIVWSIVLGVILGGIVTGGTLFTVEWWKNRNIVKNWAYNLLYEVRTNNFLKEKESKRIEDELKSPGRIKNIDVIKCFLNNFSVYNSFILSGVILKNSDIVKIYSDYIMIEKRKELLIDNFLFKYLKLTHTDKKVAPNFRERLEKIVKVNNSQQKRINNLYNLLLRETNISKEKEKELRLGHKFQDMI